MVIATVASTVAAFAALATTIFIFTLTRSEDAPRLQVLGSAPLYLADTPGISDAARHELEARDLHLVVLVNSGGSDLDLIDIWKYAENAAEAIAEPLAPMWMSEASCSSPGPVTLGPGETVALLYLAGYADGGTPDRFIANTSSGEDFVFETGDDGPGWSTAWSYREKATSIFGSCGGELVPEVAGWSLTLIPPELQTPDADPRSTE